MSLAAVRATAPTGHRPITRSQRSAPDGEPLVELAFGVHQAVRPRVRFQPDAAADEQPAAKRQCTPANQATGVKAQVGASVDSSVVSDTKENCLRPRKQCGYHSEVPVHNSDLQLKAVTPTSEQSTLNDW